jgi:hypothetical protein
VCGSAAPRPFPRVRRGAHACEVRPRGKESETTAPRCAVQGTLVLNVGAGGVEGAAQPMAIGAHSMHVEGGKGRAHGWRWRRARQQGGGGGSRGQHAPGGCDRVECMCALASVRFVLLIMKKRSTRTPPQCLFVYSQCSLSIFTFCVPSHLHGRSCQPQCNLRAAVRSSMNSKPMGQFNGGGGRALGPRKPPAHFIFFVCVQSLLPSGYVRYSWTSCMWPKLLDTPACTLRAFHDGCMHAALLASVCYTASYLRSAGVRGSEDGA